MRGKIRKEWVCIAGLFCFFAGYILLYLFPMKGYEEMVVEEGQSSFIASFEDVYYIIPANHDVTQQTLLDSTTANLELLIVNTEGEVAGTVRSGAISIHTNGYNSTENIAEDGLPVRLVPGERYRIVYHAVCGDQDLNHLSFILYGQGVRMYWLFAVVTVSALLILSGGFLLHRNGGSAPNRLRAGLVMIWIGTALLFIVSAPKMNEMEENRQAFARAYAVSSHLLGKQETDPNGYVYIEESGIRDMGYLSYSVPLNRFWSDRQSGDIREERKISSLYRISDDRIWLYPLTFPDGAAIAFARILKLPYQMVYLSGIMFNGILAFILFVLAVNRYLKEGPGDGTFRSGNSTSICLNAVIFFFLMPSVMQGTFSYLSWGVIAALIITIPAAVRNRKENRRRIAIALAAAFLVSCVSVIYRYGIRIFFRTASPDLWSLPFRRLIYLFSMRDDAMDLPVYILLIGVLGVCNVLLRGGSNRLLRFRKHISRTFLSAMIYLGLKCIVV